MIYSPTLASASIDNAVMTEFLGVVAFAAFGGLAIFGLMIMLRDSSQKRQLQEEAEAFAAAPAPAEEEDDGSAFEAEVSQMEEEYAEFYDGIVKTSQNKLTELVAQARSISRSIGLSYARNCRNVDALMKDELAKRFLRVCYSMWSFFKTELGYVGFSEINPHLQALLNAHGQMQSFSNEEAEEDRQLTPAMMRIQEVLILQKTIPSERLGMFQVDAIEALEPYKSYYNKQVKDWLNECLFLIVQKLRDRGVHGATIKDTSQRERFVKLRLILETVARLSERLEANSQEIGEEDAAYNQIIFAATVLNMVGHLPDWFPELGDSEAVREEEASATA